MIEDAHFLQFHPHQPGLLTAFQVQMETHFTVCVCFAEKYQVSIGKYPTLSIAGSLYITSVFSILLTLNQEAHKSSENQETPMSRKGPSKGPLDLLVDSRLTGCVTVGVFGVY